MLSEDLSKITLLMAGIIYFSLNEASDEQDILALLEIMALD